MKHTRKRNISINFHCQSNSEGMDTGYGSRPTTGFESGVPMVYGHSISGGSESSGGSAGMGGKPFAFKTNTRGGTTMRSAHRDFGVLGYVECIHLNHNKP